MMEICNLFNQMIRIRIYHRKPERFGLAVYFLDGSFVQRIGTWYGAGYTAYRFSLIKSIF